MFDWLSDPQAWAGLMTLAVLEIVLGIDNLIFLSIISAKLPPHQQPLARQLGLGLALGGRVVLLLAIGWVIGLTAPAFTIMGFTASWRDIVLILGGLFLLAKGTMEIHHALEPGPGAGSANGPPHYARFSVVIVQIFLLDLVFSLDSVLTAVGMVSQIGVMILAVVIAMLVMLLAAEPVSGFVNRHPTVKMLALSFLLLIGMTLIAEGAHTHVPRGYIYVAIAFSVGVEALNLIAARRRAVSLLAHKEKGAKS
jgi:predicted tellurium resistance membrane protein TerC